MVESLANGLVSLGQSSEEVFRGDRLPLLHFPQDSLEDSQTSDL
ncbi:MAG: hypothetical protein ACOC3E_01895 [Cyanobacteriota bacterium]